MIPKPEKRVKQRKPLRQKGKVGEAWDRKRAQYLATHPPTIWPDRWPCAICGNPVDRPNLEIDHIVDRSIAPDLREDDNNLQIVHRWCNGQKKLLNGGSRRSPA